MTSQISIPMQGMKENKLAATKESVIAQAKAGSRLLFVDNVRVCLTILVVVHHLAITYGAGGSWPYQERPSTELTEIVLSLFNILNHFYFMGLFFLIAGYFVPGSIDRKGTWLFLKDRFIRLGIPLVIFGFLLSPIGGFVWSVQNGRWQGNLGQFYAQSLRNLAFNSGPLWFVETLLIFSAVYVVGRAVVDWLKARRISAGFACGGNTEPAVSQPLTHRTILAIIPVLALVSFAVRLAFPLETAWHNLQFAMFPQYILLFAAGILAYRRGWLPDLPPGVRRTWSAIAILAIITLPLIMVFGGAIENSEAFNGGMTVQSLITSTWEAVYCISMPILILSFFRQRIDQQGSLGRLLSKNAYTAYIIHAPVLVVLAWLLRDVSIYPLLKYILVAPVAVGLCFSISHFLVRRVPLAEKVL